ncbi:uncharacterized protein LOC115454631 [Manduca sexta]|uniref:uncharacterized protein LOC115454631 n=1 Tax=Manduca sexta TaxID=7130 RepID=UPI00188E0555|nr:uncharacterized protein LOC115454631 [Manduca sexta]
MEYELCIHPLHLRRQYLATKYLLKAQSFANNITISILQKISSDCAARYWRKKKKPLLVSILEEIKTEKFNKSEPLNMFKLNTWMTNVKTDFIKTDIDGIKVSKNKCNSGTLKFNVIKMLNTDYQNFHKIFTDGSKTGNRAGAAFYDPSRNVKELFKIVSPCNNIMSVELFAISEAISYATTSDNKDVVILTDSRSALQHIARCTSLVRGASIAYAILKKILSLQKNGIDLRLQWIPSHIGIRGNEVADSLAKDSLLNGSQTYIWPENTEILNKYKYKIFEKWKIYNDNKFCHKGIWYKILQPEPPRTPLCAISSMKREYVVIAHRLRSGHMPLNKFKHLMRHTDSPNCSTCGVPEDVYHLLTKRELSIYGR